jgi:hypothetical protein
MNELLALTVHAFSFSYPFSHKILLVMLFVFTAQATLFDRAKASVPGFQVLPLRQFGSWGPEIATKLDPQKDTYVMVCAKF